MTCPSESRLPNHPNVDCGAAEPSPRATSVADWEVVPSGVRWRPAMLTVPGTGLPASWEHFWTESRSVLFESGRTGRWTVLARTLEPVCEEVALEPAAALAVLSAWQRANSGVVLPGWPAFQGGLAVLLAYDVARAYEPVPLRAEAEAFPPLIAGFVREALVYDHQENTVTAVVLGENVASVPLAAQHAACLRRAEALLADWFHVCAVEGPVVAAPGNVAAVPPSATFDEGSFCAAVRRIQEYIAAGDTYQVNLSLRRSFPLRTTPDAVYEALRRINPSPYMGLLRTPTVSLVCGSPELLVRTGEGKIESRPIAGTRPRGTDPAADLAFLEELRDNVKERAEHLMLVDLLRNDLGRVAVRGTVEVDEFMAIEGYSHVMHLVSHISGKLETTPPVDVVLRSVFPGGTITGAPKVRTMQIIEELEPVRRGYYTGAFGWLGLDGAVNLNIIIRSLVVRGGVAHVQSGAGIVADSDPVREYQESLNKARALLRAVEVAETAARERHR